MRKYAKKISELDLVTTPSNDDSFAGVQDGENYGWLISQILRSPVDRHNVMHYGAIGDGATDDTIAIQAACDAAIIDGKPVYFPAGIYRTTLTITAYGNISLEGASASSAVIAPDGDFTTFALGCLAADATAATTVSAEMEAKDSKVTLTNASDISVGDLLVFTSNVLWYWDNRGTLYKGEIHTAKSITGNVVTLTSPVTDNYDISGAEVVTVTAFPRYSVHIKNLSIEANLNIDSILVKIAYMQDSSIDSLNLLNSDNAGISLGSCYGVSVRNVSIRLNADITDGLGYGIQSNSSVNVRIYDSIFVDCRRGVDFSGPVPSRFCEVANCVVTNENQIAPGNTSGFGTHGPAENILFANNIIHGCRIGIYSRGGNISITGNHFSGGGQQCILATHGNNLYVANNSTSGLVGRTGLTTNLGWLSWITFLYVGADFDAVGEITVSNNMAFQVNNAFVYSLSTDIRWNINGNTVVVRSSVGATNVYFLAGAVDLANSKIFGNNYRVIIGTKNWYDAGTVNYTATELEFPIKIKEIAAALPDTAGYGQLWVKNTTPCELWFTDDAGADTQLV